MAVVMVVMIVDNFRTRPQFAHSFEFQFQRGAVGIQAGAFTQSPLLRQRNEAMIAFYPDPERRSSESPTKAPHQRRQAKPNDYRPATHCCQFAIDSAGDVSAARSVMFLPCVTASTASAQGSPPFSAMKR